MGVHAHNEQAHTQLKAMVPRHGRAQIQFPLKDMPANTTHATEAGGDHHV